MAASKIFNEKTNRFVSINGRIGQQILKHKEKEYEKQFPKYHVDYVFTSDECDEYLKDKTINPRTKRKITEKQKALLEKQCRERILPNMIIVDKGGGDKFKRSYYIHEDLQHDIYHYNIQETEFYSPLIFDKIVWFMVNHPFYIDKENNFCPMKLKLIMGKRKFRYEEFVLPDIYRKFRMFPYRKETKYISFKFEYEEDEKVTIIFYESVTIEEFALKLYYIVQEKIPSEMQTDLSGIYLIFRPLKLLHHDDNKRVSKWTFKDQL